MNEHQQFETIAALRAYAKQLLRLTRKGDIRPSTGKLILPIISRMHNIKEQLEIRS
jgi:hypothetical protein